MIAKGMIMVEIKRNPAGHDYIFNNRFRRMTMSRAFDQNDAEFLCDNSVILHMLY